MCSSSVTECDRVFFLFEKAKIVCSKTFLPHFFLFCICKIYIFSVLYVVMRRLLLIFVVVHFYILQHREMWNISRGNSSRCLIVIKTLRKLKQKIELKDMKAGTLVARGFLVVANFSIGLCEVCGKRWNRYATLPVWRKVLQLPKFMRRRESVVCQTYNFGSRSQRKLQSDYLKILFMSSEQISEI